MIACIGGAHLDRHGVLRGPLVLGTSNPGHVHTAFGGVARNVAENLARLGVKTTLISRVGDDETGRQVLRHAANLGIDTAFCSISPERHTASYTAIVDQAGELVVGLADRDIYLEVQPDILAEAMPVLNVQQYWFIDANLPPETIAWLLDRAGETPVALDAISVTLAEGLRSLISKIPLLFANLQQAAALTGVAGTPVEAAAALRALGVRQGVLTAGSQGIAIWTPEAVEARPAIPAVIRDVTGAGDALVAATLYGLIHRQTLSEAANLGLKAAALTVESADAVSAFIATLAHAR